MNLTGPLKKLASELSNPINYSLVVGNERLPLNELLGRQLELSYHNEIYCIQCNRQTKKSFQQGYCYPCYLKLMECNLCIIHPERCKHPHSPCPDTWEHDHCKQEHIVYMANGSALKVGITRRSQAVTRWIDQGAIQAIPLFKVDNRYDSGRIEVALKKHMADKTNWRKMLAHQTQHIDMKAAKEDLLKTAHSDLQELLASMPNHEHLNDEQVHLEYPIMSIPKKINASSFDKENIIGGRLMGVKGQYLLFEHQVLNIRKHGGYKVSVTVHD